jgi:hypothetical protein
VRWWKRRPAALEPVQPHPVDVAREDLPPDPGYHVLEPAERVTLIRSRLREAEADCYEFELMLAEADAVRPCLSADDYAAITGPHLREIDMGRRRRALLLGLLEDLT